MTVRTDITVDFNLSPRLITVEAPSTSLNMQDLVDTLREIEDELINMDEPHLINAAGKEDLGGGVNVGITATLQNAQLAFEARVTPDESGTATSTGTTTLVDTTALFETNGILRGAMLINYTDGSIGTVISVTNETTLVHQALQGGVANDWTIGDVYTVTNEIQCNVSGGNLVAVDENDAVIDPIFPTVGTQVVRTSSSSATISDLGITSLQYLTESLRESHSAFGTIYFWDPVSGKDTNDGTSPETPFLTFSAAQTAVTDHEADVIFIMNTSAAALTITERLTITKNDLNLRGPGKSVLFSPTDDAGPTITVNANNVSLSGFSVESTGATPQSAVDVGSFDRFRMQDISITQCTEDGLHVEGGEDHLIENCDFSRCDGSGIHLVNTVRARIFRNRIQRNGNTGMALEETSGGMSEDNWIGANVFHHNGNAAINNGSGVSMTIITKDNYFGPPPGTAGGDDIVDNGVATHNEYTEWAEHMARTYLDFADGIETGMTPRQASRLFLAASAGKLNGAATSTINIRDTNDSKNRIVATVDSDGNRTAVTLDTS